MRKTSFTAPGIGAPSLLLILVILSLSILSALTLMSARNDMKLSARSAEVTASVYKLYGEAEEALASLDALVGTCREKASSEEEFLQLLCENLPERVAFCENMLYIKGTDGTREVTLKAQPHFDGSRRLTVLSETLGAVTEDTWN